jgi:hypothetical protein
LIAPAIPGRFCLAGEKFEIGAAYQALDTLSDFIWLSTVFSAAFFVVRGRRYR